MDKITPAQISLSLSHFTDVWDPHVGASSTSRHPHASSDGVPCFHPLYEIEQGLMDRARSRRIE
jgi:hypothetical protein